MWRHASIGDMEAWATAAHAASPRDACILPVDQIDRAFFAQTVAERRTHRDSDAVWDVVTTAPVDDDGDAVEERPRGYTVHHRNSWQPGEGSPTGEQVENSAVVPSAPSKLRKYARKTGLTKSWVSWGPNLILAKCTSDTPSRGLWRERVAEMRSMRLAVVVMQALIRRDAIRSSHDRHLLEKLPRQRQRRDIIAMLASNGYARRDIRNMMHVLDGRTDQDKCERFLSVEGHKPIWLLHFVTRPSAKLIDAGTLHRIIAYCKEVYDGRREWEKGPVEKGALFKPGARTKLAMLNMSPQTFGNTLQMLASQCMVVDGRLLPGIADTAAQYIRNMAEWNMDSSKIYHLQCQLFNTTLAAMAPSNRRLPPRWYRSMSFYWEAQKSLLSMSASFDRPLVVDREGFQATWPPYLAPGDGMDEMTQPEDNWSRSVSAGTLQQEAGYPLDESDAALDILGGRAPDGTPTIQQRVVLGGSSRKMGTWEASIRATRNAEEAWIKFNKPPRRGAAPGVREYAAMFAKLCARNADPQSALRPGDRALNFPVQPDPNLSEFARTRMQPPSVDELYTRMRSAGIRPDGACLEVLVANAASLDRAHAYLRDSRVKAGPLLSYRSSGPNAKALRQIPTPIVAAYVRLICTVESRPGRELFRALRICDRRFEDDDGSRLWAPFVWGVVLKAMSAKTAGLGRLGRTLAEQVRAYQLVVDKIEDSAPLRLSTVVQLAKCLRKAAARAVGERMTDLEAQQTAASESPLTFLYDADSRQRLVAQLASRSGREIEDGRHTMAAGSSGGGSDGSSIGNIGGSLGDENPWLYFLLSGADRLKKMHKRLADREVEATKLFDTHNARSLDHMLARQDAVRAQDAYELMASWAFLGEFETMASMLEWQLKQNPGENGTWTTASVTPDVPTDFMPVLCLFRQYAEPMLSEERVEGIRAAVEAADVAWSWPDDETVEDFSAAVAAGNDASYMKLLHVLEWIRYRQARERGESAEKLLRPPRWGLG
ncbi:hypothetical protein GMORB2_1288 [Geosmithia morbida]|uniref:Uncharacterized protein n=1 Tax=Geosmithia morbida TaxID=1094350 RepID=A0A9P4Z0U1_9HYPO|nr:uncharacterized protein GMORB2_1288 [Geosmithia morbida]KAF4126042.1 hypothetical protein GMORB2_1288 [Geosmithia morbida]